MQCTFIAKEGGTNQVVGIPFRHCPEAYSSKALRNVPSAMRHDCFRGAKKKARLPAKLKAHTSHQYFLSLLQTPGADPYSEIAESSVVSKLRVQNNHPGIVCHKIAPLSHMKLSSKSMLTQVVLGNRSRVCQCMVSIAQKRFLASASTEADP